MAAKDRLIVGLDVPNVAEATEIVRKLGSSVDHYKIGYQLAFAGGLEFARELARDGKKIFLDMKLLDIDNTVASGVENIARMGMTMLTLHAYPKAMRAAVEAARGSGLCLLGVTVLTSMDEQDLIEAGYEYDPHTLVLRRAEQARRDARHPAGGCGKGRPEAGDDACRRHPRRREPPRGGAADRQGARSARGSAGDPCGNRRRPLDLGTATTIPSSLE